MLSATFTSPPRLLGDLNRLFGAKVSSLLEDGGSIALYGVDRGKLLPRPLGVIVLPSDRREAVESFAKTIKSGEAIGIKLRTAEVGDSVVLSFDNSIEQYLKDGFDPRSDPSGAWEVRIDPLQLVPVLNDLGQNLGLRVVSPRLFRSARDLDQWISGLEQAKTIEATDSVDSERETLRVRIAAK